jgi:hypothetical protein
MRKFIATAAMIACMPMTAIAEEPAQPNADATQSEQVTIGQMMSENGLSAQQAIQAAMSADPTLSLTDALAQAAQAGASADELLQAALVMTGDNETLALQALFDAAESVGDEVLSIAAVRTAAVNAEISNDVIEAALEGAGLPATAGGSTAQNEGDTGQQDNTNQTNTGFGGDTGADSVNGGVNPPPARTGQPIS